ncbi:MAG: hypothetical protein DRP51_01220 [Candidatus Zixiibacteriota bacterium]|nr:MAG: hypothetical protein DRP51_01220 [candidate division Zixibacteria bacterium]
MKMNRKNKDQIDIGEIRAIIWKRKWLIILPTILVACVAYAGSHFIKPVYETSIIIWVGKSLSLSGDFQRYIGDDAYGSRRQISRREELRSLQNEIVSTPYIHQLVDRLELDRDAALDETAEEMQSQMAHLTREQIKFTLLLEELREKIRIEFSGLDQVKITTEGNDPFLTQDMARTLGEIFIEEKRKARMSAVRVSQNFSYEQLARYEPELERKIAARTELEKEFINIQLDGLIISEENRRLIKSEISADELEISDWEQEAGQILAKITEIPSGKITLEKSSTHRRLEREMHNHLNSIGSIMLKHQWNAPEILNFRARLYSYIDELEAENNRLVRNQFSEYDESTQAKIISLMNARTRLDMLYSKKNNLELGYAELQNNIDLIPEYQARLEQLNREVAAAQEIRDRLKQQQESATIKEDILRESEFKVIQPAQLPLYPIRPDKRKLILMGILFGAIIGGGLVLMVELMDNSFKRVEDVEEYLGIPVIGVIPVIDSLRKTKIKSIN